MIDRNEVLALIDGCEEQALESADGSGGGRGGIEAAFRRLREALAAKDEPQGGEAWQMQLANALESFWNPAVGAIQDASYHGPASGSDVVGAIAQGFAAIAGALREQQQAIHPAPKPAEGEGWVLVPESVLRWLYGKEGDFECPPDRYFRGKPAPYWWRSVLREKLAAAPKKGEG